MATCIRAYMHKAYVCIRACMYAYLCVRTCIDTCNVHMCIRACMHTWTHAHMHTYIGACVHACMRAHASTDHLPLKVWAMTPAP